MFQVNEYKIVFKRVWHQTRMQKEDYSSGFIIPETDGRYDTVCEIYVCKDFAPRFTGIAKLHPNDCPDKIVGKKIALRNAISNYNWPGREFKNKEFRTAIWKAFWKWVASWSPGHAYLYCRKLEG